MILLCKLGDITYFFIFFYYEIIIRVAQFYLCLDSNCMIVHIFSLFGICRHTDADLYILIFLYRYVEL